ncbi:MAG TPA: response regulator [Methylomirabilota bacterium]|jgi:two-component system chemotaxis response regulator CheY
MSAKILIVEDSRSMRRIVRAALEQDGHQVAESEDGRQALAALREVTPELIITDINMPEVDGISLVREIRRLPAFRFTPVIILTTESGDDAKENGRAAGATGWIVKPFDPDRLRHVVAQVLGTRGVA